jgi:hypothetical protein
MVKMMEPTTRREKRLKISVIVLCIIVISSLTWTQAALAQSDYPLETKYVEENFGDDSKIASSRNVVIDTGKGEASLMKIMTTFGGNEGDHGNSVQQTSDGGYIILGGTQSYGAGYWDMWLIKTDSNGKEEWNRTFGGSEFELGQSVRQTPDGGYVFTGWTESYGAGDHDVWLIKTDSSGNEDWNRTFGGSGTDYGHYVILTTDGGYAVAGMTRPFGTDNTSAWLIKTDSSGNEQWNSVFGGSMNDYGMSVHQTSDGGYVLGGSTESFGAGKNDVFLIKTDAFGNEEWNRTFGGTEIDYGITAEQTSDGGYIVTGDSRSFGNGQSDAWLIKTDASGSEEWNRTYGGTESDMSGFHLFGDTVQQLSDGGYVIAGTTVSFGAGSFDFWLIKTDASGNEEWNRTFGGLERDYGHSVQQTSDGGYVLVGETHSYGAGGFDVWFIKTDVSGNIHHTSGELVSTNLLEGIDVHAVDGFNCIGYVPYRAGLKVQFSQDGVNWYDSLGNTEGWDALSDGLNHVDLSALSWSGPSFYYRANFTSDTDQAPVLREISASYKQQLQPLPSNNLLLIGGLVAACIAIFILAALLAKSKKEEGAQELPPEKLDALLEKKKADGKVSDEAYEDIKVLLKKYRNG